MSFNLKQLVGEMDKEHRQAFLLLEKMISESKMECLAQITRMKIEPYNDSELKTNITSLNQRMINYSNNLSKIEKIQLELIEKGKTIDLILNELKNAERILQELKIFRDEAIKTISDAIKDKSNPRPILMANNFLDLTEWTKPKVPVTSMHDDGFCAEDNSMGTVHTKGRIHDRSPGELNKELLDKLSGIRSSPSCTKGENEK